MIDVLTHVVVGTEVSVREARREYVLYHRPVGCCIQIVAV